MPPARFKRTIPATKRPLTYERLDYRIPICQKKLKQTAHNSWSWYIQGGSNMTGTDLCVNKLHCTAAAQCGLFTHKSVPVIFEPPCTCRASLRLIQPIWCNQASCSWGICSLGIFKNIHCFTTQSSHTDFIFKFWDHQRFCWTKDEKNVIRFGLV